MTKPEVTFRLGSCSASVFVNHGKNAAFRSVSLQRRYREGDKWKTSSNFTLRDLPLAIAALQLALQHVATHESDVKK
jgi:hypothetical protein